jgi:hypothetical protein
MQDRSTHLILGAHGIGLTERRVIIGTKESGLRKVRIQQTITGRADHTVTESHSAIRLIEVCMKIFM